MMATAVAALQGEKVFIFLILLVIIMTTDVQIAIYYANTSAHPNKDNSTKTVYYFKFSLR